MKRKLTGLFLIAAISLAAMPLGSSGAYADAHVLIFTKHGRTVSQFSYTINDDGRVKHLICNLEGTQGDTYNVYRSGSDHVGSFPLDSNNSIYFETDETGEATFQVTKGDPLPDTTPPTGTIEITSVNPVTGQIITERTKTATVTLNLSATDSGSGVTRMRLSNDEVNWEEFDYATTKSWELIDDVAEGDEKEKIVRVRFKDAAGNWSQSFNDSIILDKKVDAPSAPIPLGQ